MTRAPNVLSWAETIQRLTKGPIGVPEESGFLQLANVGHLQVDETYDLGEELQIRRAGPNEIAILKQILLPNPFAKSTLDLPLRNPYETAHLDGTVSPLPEDQWRYHVVAYQPGSANVDANKLVEASVLTTNRLHGGPSITVFAGDMRAVGGHVDEHIWNSLRDDEEEGFLTLTTSDLVEMEETYSKFSSFEHELIDLAGAVNRFCQLDSIPQQSPLRFLGYVAIIESLITHQPAPSDPYDSLTRQVTQKMLLIGRRSKLKIPYEMLGSASQDTIWKRLYACRSKVAHGSPPDFSGQFSILVDYPTALSFLARSTVVVMRQALEEPDLIADLKAC